MNMEIEKPIVRDILDTPGAPALSSVSDMPVIETKPDAQNEGAPPEQPAADSTESTTTAESATAEPTDEQPGAAPEANKPPRGVQKRLDELTKQREEANRRAEAADQRLDRALAALERATGKPAEETKQELETQDPEPSRPMRGSFDDIDAYETALLDFTEQKAAWVARREVKAARAEYERERTDQAIASEQTKVKNAYNERRAKVAEKHPDFDAVATNPEVVVPGIVAQAIVHDEHGPELQYYFGKNPDEAKRLMDLSNPYLQLVELGTIKARLAGNVPAPPTVSAAPKPITPIKPSGSDLPPAPAEQSMEAYAASVRKREGWGDPQRRRH